MNGASPSIDYQSRLRDALIALQRMQARLDAVERDRTEPIAIVGIGCRLPGHVSDPQGFWALLRDGVDAVSEVPADRWDVDAYYDPDHDVPGKTYARWGGFLESVDQFDPGFFGISRREARSIDPQHRLLLEVSIEALHDAGQPLDKLHGSRTGVFIGITTDDYHQLQAVPGDFTAVDGYRLTGTVLNAAAGRVSYVLGLQGPCMALDTACSSSLVAVHLACHS